MLVIGDVLSLVLASTEILEYNKRSTIVCFFPFGNMYNNNNNNNVYIMVAVYRDRLKIFRDEKCVGGPGERKCYSYNKVEGHKEKRRQGEASY